MKIKELIQKLEVEIKQTQKAVEQTTSLSRLKEIAKVYTGDDEIISSKEIKEKIQSEPEEVGVMTGWGSFDKIIKGFRLGQVITVSGITKHGKTSFCIDMTCKMREQNPLWFPLEEGSRALVMQFLDRGEEPPLFFTPRNIKLYSTEWIELKIIESIAKYGTKIVFIDQLDFIVPFTGDTHHLRVGQAMRDLKHIAQKWGIIIVLICHLRKTRLDSNPDLDDLKGSGSIAQESDTVIIIWRETTRNTDDEVVILNNVNVSIQANRRFGTTGNVKMVYREGHFFEEEHMITDGQDKNAESYDNF